MNITNVSPTIIFHILPIELQSVLLGDGVRAIMSYYDEQGIDEFSLNLFKGWTSQRYNDDIIMELCGKNKFKELVLNYHNSLLPTDSKFYTERDIDFSYINDELNKYLENFIKKNCVKLVCKNGRVLHKLITK